MMAGDFEFSKFNAIMLRVCTSSIQYSCNIIETNPLTFRLFVKCKGLAVPMKDC